MRYRFIILISVIIGWSFAAYADAIEAYEHPKPLPVPNLEIAAQDANIHSLKDYQGKVILLNFWATWCKPCLEEMPLLSRLHTRLDAQKAQVLTVSLDRKGLQVSRQFLQRLGISNLPVVLDKDYAALQKFRLSSLPTTIIVTPNFEEVARIEGVLEWDDPSVVAYLESLFTK